MSVPTRLMIAVTLGLVGCGSTPPAPANPDAITGAERFGWDQPASDAAELTSFRYAMYVDDVRSDAADVSCATVQTSGRFPCTARIPDMPAGTHTLQVAAFILDAGATRESARSTAVRVVKQ